MLLSTESQQPPSAVAKEQLGKGPQAAQFTQPEALYTAGTEPQPSSHAQSAAAAATDHEPSLGDSRHHAQSAAAADHEARWGAVQQPSKLAASQTEDASPSAPLLGGVAHWSNFQNSVSPAPHEAFSSVHEAQAAADQVQGDPSDKQQPQHAQHRTEGRVPPHPDAHDDADASRDEPSAAEARPDSVPAQSSHELQEKPATAEPGSQVGDWLCCWQSVDSTTVLLFYNQMQELLITLMLMNLMHVMSNNSFTVSCIDA